MNVTIRCSVQGRVQGVFFRASTQKEAKNLGLLGWARNLPDGSVEVLATGTEEAVNQLKIWLKNGPPEARVDSLKCELLSSLPEMPVGFQIY